MDYFRKYISGQPGEAAPSGTETVERLVDRVQSSTLLEDRRDATRALKALSRKFRLDVGTRATGPLVNILEQDRNDTEITGYALETLCNVMSTEPFEDDAPGDYDESMQELGLQFTEMFIKTPGNVSLLLSLLEEYDFHVRWPTVRLLTILLTNKSKDLQEVILVSPMGVSRLMDLLSDSREIIRNDGLLLLIQLTKNNANIQKIVAFESAFERLLDIVNEEGLSDGGIVVEDCLLLLLNLLKNNVSNQNFFKEGSYIQHLSPFFNLEPADENPQGGWSAQKVSNIHLMLQVIRTLISPSNPSQNTASCQRVMNQCGLLQQLCTILMASGVPADVLTETINTVAEAIRGNASNQEYFASVMAPSSPPRPAIVVLLMSMVNDKQPFLLRCAVLYCFQCFLYKNELGQSQIIQTLLPATADANTISAGQLLCGGLFSSDSLSTWFAATALLHSIVDNASQKEQLLRVQLATSLGNPPVSLLQQCSNILSQGGKLQTRVGLLMLMCQWMANCPIAVTHFLHHANNIPFLISMVSSSEGDEQELIVQGLCAFILGICVFFNTDEVENYQRQHMRNIIEKRIGLEQFTDKLGQVTKHELYSKAAKQVQLSAKQPSEMLFDHMFTKLFKKLENDVLASVSPVQENGESDLPTRATLDQHENVVKQYKELIREQDGQLTSVKSELSALQNKYDEADKQIADMMTQIQNLKDQNALLKVANRSSPSATGSDSNDSLSQLQNTISQKESELEVKDTRIAQLESELRVVQINQPLNDVSSEETPDLNQLMSQINGLQLESQELRHKLEQREEDIKLYKGKYEETLKQIAELRQSSSNSEKDDSSVNSALLAEHNTMSERLSSLESSNRSLEEEKLVLQSKLELSETEKTKLDNQIKGLAMEAEENREALEEAEVVKKEQEDLLVLLADQDNKLKSYRKRLKQHGEEVSDDEDDEEDDEDDGELD